MKPGWRARLASVALACALPLGHVVTVAAAPMPATATATITTAKDDPAVTGRFRTLWLKLRGRTASSASPSPTAGATRRGRAARSASRVARSPGARAIRSPSGRRRRRRRQQTSSREPALVRSGEAADRQRLEPAHATRRGTRAREAAEGGRSRRQPARSAQRLPLLRDAEVGVRAMGAGLWQGARRAQLRARRVLGAPDGPRRRRPGPFRCGEHVLVVRANPPGAVGRPQRAPVRVHRPLPEGAGGDHRLRGRAVAPARRGSHAREGHEEGRGTEPRGALRPAAAPRYP